MTRRIGSQNYNAKLTEMEVECIRYRVESKREKLKAIKRQIEELNKQRALIMAQDTIPQLAFDFEVSQSTIKNVLYRVDCWGHVE